MHLELLVEEVSAEAALIHLLPRIVEVHVTFAIHSHHGKTDLLNKLPGRLQGYRSWIPADWRIIVLVDEDRADCRELKGQLEIAATKAGFFTRGTAPSGQAYQLVNRIAVEELEAWFFGDVPAIAAAYPGVSPNLGKQAKYRNPDQIGGGTWEALERVLKRAGHYRGGLAKIEAAREIAQHMDPGRNTSPSFRAFYRALRAFSTSNE